MSPVRRIGILGAGAWGTALAHVAACAGHSVDLWGRHAMGDATSDTGVTPTRTMADLSHVDIVLAVVPTQALRAVVDAFGATAASAPLVVCAKGIETGTGLFVSDIVADVSPERAVAVLSGPSFAHDVTAGLPTAVTIAARDLGLAEDIGAALATQTFRLYHTDDVRGVEIGGAAKNVLAIACGIAAGRELGASAAAALVARGFAELTRFGRAFGARSETLMGLSGLGDLVLTCGSTQSRNFAFGQALGRGASPEQAAGGKLAEGAYTAGVILELARARAIDMPIAQAVDAVLRGALSIDAAVEALMARPQRGEG